ncbi:MAG: hypothetical protein A2808_04000 [Candidatus Moranbacteria bacterium RIFCSPHIGHO2_01_FULL_55_24]|nr:MAG: hypothetical protein A2808_04000 [Candidatus Moranbacteria bacterium RIFCSPHIGHO2_01_FULL_55_24]
MFGFTQSESSALKRLSTPQKIQDFLDQLPLNHEKQGDTYMSPRRVLREEKAHCFEGALLAAAALSLQGRSALIMDLTSARGDDDHVIALFKENGYWGAISKTNHAVLRYRDPIYRTLRELALSYFHEYFLNTDGKKTLKSYSRPLDLLRFGEAWATAEEDLWDIALALDDLPHYALVPEANRRKLRPASWIEREAGEIVEWKKGDKRT